MSKQNRNASPNYVSHAPGTAQDAREISLPQEHDLNSVGSRVSWPAVVAGVVVAMASATLLTAFAGAIGLSTVNGETSGRTIAITAGIVWLFIVVISLFLGGYVATRMTTREDTCEASVIGILVWGTTAMLLAAGVGAGTGLALDATRTAKVMTADRPFWESQPAAESDRLATELNLTAEQSRKYDQLREKAREATSTTRAPSAQEAAWWTFAGLLLSIVASLGGALFGAGPDVSRRFFGWTAVGVVRHPEPVTVAR
jgi:hypothetical protein